MLTTKRIVLALVVVTLTCLLPTVCFGQDSVLSERDSGAYNVAFYVNAHNASFPAALPGDIVHVGNPGSTGGFGSGDPGVVAGGDLCANIYVFTEDQQLVECCSCRITPNGMQGFNVNSDLTNNPLTADIPHNGAIKIVSSFGGGERGHLPPTVDTRTARNFCDAGTNYWPQGRLEAWVTHTRALGTPAFSVTEIDFQSAQLSYSELKKLEQQCFAIEADPSLGGLGSGHGTCTCDPEKSTS